MSKTNSKSKIVYQPQTEVFGNYREIVRRFANTEKAKRAFGYEVNYTSTEVIDEIIKSFENENREVITPIKHLDGVYELLQTKGEVLCWKRVT